MRRRYTGVRQLAAAAAVLVSADNETAITRRLVLHARGGVVRDKHLSDQEEVFWFLTVVQNAIVLWNVLGLEQAIDDVRRQGGEIPEDDLAHVLPLMVEHINFVGRFALDMNRRPPFRLVA
ncbi:MAG: Tn3 family transposase [Candidatus Schekmanbacteria bacterium]|nr:Tn3 family transposase [Candidatus Schekmanbacteria bacterium]